MAENSKQEASTVDRSPLSNFISKISKKNMGVYFGLIVLIVVSSILSPIFLKPDNIFNTLRQASAIGIVSIGATIVILNGGIDLSVGSLLSLTACMTTGLMAGKNGVTIPVILAVMAVGLLFGMVNGVIITKMRVEPFIITLGTSTAMQGIVLLVTKGSPVGQIAPNLKFLGNGYVWLIPVPVIVFAFIFAITAIVLHRTVFGRYVFSVGGNAEAARLSGIKVDKTKIIVYMLSGLSASIAGIVLAARVSVGDPYIGRGFELDAIAAAVIGGTSMSGGVGSLGGTIAGVLIITVMNNMLNLMNVSPFIQQIVKGLIIIAAVVFQKRPKK
ncbi:MAG: ABC transporter permease [Ruminiclostridium sp.]